MWKNRLVYLLFLIGMGIFYLEYDAWISCFVFVLTAVLPLFSLLCSLPGLCGNRVEISVRGRCQREEENDIRISLRKKTSGLYPRCRVRVVLRDLMSGEESPERFALYGGTTEILELGTQHCGTCCFEVVRGNQYDFLGLFRFALKTPEPQLITVLPRPCAPEPRPDFSAFYSRIWVPTTDGFSEVHEHRAYRPGDPLKTVHWKLSAKVDDLIVREPQEALLKTAVVTFDLSPERAETDSTLDRLLWLSRRLLELGVPHTLCCASAADAIISCPVASDSQLDQALDRILLTELPRRRVSIEHRSFEKADWRYHVRPAEGEVEL